MVDFPSRTSALTKVVWRCGNALILAATIATAIPASASASYDWLPVFQRAAVKHWGHGTLPPCGTPGYIWSPIAGSTVAQVLRDAHGDLTCQVQIDPSQWAWATTPDRCRVIVHEVGHLYGQQHTPRGIMAAQLNLARFWPCDRLMRRIEWCRTTGGDWGCSMVTVPRRDVIES